MKIQNTSIQGLHELNIPRFEDARGSFVKPFFETVFNEISFATCFAEVYYSISKKNVIRGMHFQLPPYDHEKLVYVTHGCVLDVVLDVRVGSSTYGQYYSQVLSADNNKGFYIGKGLAHGFLALEEDSLVMYHVTTVQNRGAESGIKYDSFGFDWAGVQEPVMSERDQKLMPFDEFQSPW